MNSRTVLLALGLLLVPSAQAGLGETLNSTTCTGAGVLQLCFTAAADLGPVLVPTDAILDPGLGADSPIGYAGIVRLVIVPGLVEPALVGAAVGAPDLCAIYAAAPFACVPVLSLPLAAPTLDPSVTTETLSLGQAVVGSLTIKLNGQTAAVIPGYVDIVCSAGDSRYLNPDCAGASEGEEAMFCGPGSVRAFDADCDGWDNMAEHSANSNPFYKYSTPGDNGSGFLGSPLRPEDADWDADGDDNLNELWYPGDGSWSNPFQRCSVWPDNWEPGQSCEDTPALGVI